MENNVAKRLNNVGITLGIINTFAGIAVCFMKLNVYEGYTGYTFSEWSSISLVYGGILIFSGLITYFLLSGFATLIENSSKQVKLLELISGVHEEKSEEEVSIEETVNE